MMLDWFRSLVFELVARPFVWLVMGLNVHYRDKLPKSGPMILVANHNSHLDTTVLMTLFDRKRVSQVRPVAAADYFLRGGLISWFFTRMVRIIPLERCGDIHANADRLSAISEALGRGEIIIFFPEGTRGRPEELAPFKRGISRLAQAHPDVPVVPVFLQGLGRVLPKGDPVIVPFLCDVVIGDPIRFSEVSSRERFQCVVERSVHDLSHHVKASAWL